MASNTQHISAELRADEERYCSWGDTVHYNTPVRFFTRSEGTYLFDEQDNRFLDFQMMYSAANFGYRNSYFDAALTDQLGSLPQLASEYVTIEKVRLSKAIAVAMMDRWNEEGRVHFNVGGAQAIDDSLKLISANKGHRRVFAFEGSYHGRTIGASSITSSFRYRRGYGEFGSRAHFVPFPYCFRCPYGKTRDTCELYCVGQVARLFESEYHGVLDPRSGETEFAAFYVEPIQGTGGYIVPPEGYFRELKKILDPFGILFVVDEIQMGMYRTGKLWAIEHFDVVPDIVVFGKSLTNGMNPLSGLWARNELISPQRFPPGSTHSTFGNNPLGMRLGCAAFEWCAQKEYETTVKELGSHLLVALRELQSRHPEIGDVDGLGLAARIEMCQADGKTPNRSLTERIHATALNISVDTDIGPLRLVLDIGGYYKNVFTLAPALDITQADIARFVHVFEQHLVLAKAYQ
jgi:4-aminobutyrate aminotransferase-like enzyme